ncbi:MAG: type III pantothenate kinase [Gemmatimonadaceae bacterium]|nr:type III pantothenate kinase [Gemmatimonadaceae bacterium]
MLLVFDVGNSETTVGLFDEARLVGHWRLPTLSQRSVMETRAWLMHTLHHAALAASDVTAVAIASVVPAAVEPIVQSCELAFGQAPLLVTAHSALPLEVAVEQPSAVGIDRLLNTLAAHQLFGVDAICVDAGTATTLDCVTGTGVFLGGVIMPGVLTAATSLLANTAQLSLSQFTAPGHAMGTNTTDCLRAGIWFGAAEAIDGVVRRLVSEWPGSSTPLVIATGGFSGALSGLCQSFARVEPALTLHGVRLAHEHLTR